MLHRRTDLLSGPTPLHVLPAVSSMTSGLVSVKRDDLAGGNFCGSGNKLRKFEYVLYDARRRGATALLTSGSLQSNHCMTTASVAAKNGLECALVLEERPPGATPYDPSASGNNYLYGLLDAKAAPVPHGSTLEEEIERRQKEMESRGLVVYRVAGGASTPLGALGYVRCVGELMQDTNLAEYDAIVCASGSGGTHAGLLVGTRFFRLPVRVIGVSVRSAAPEQTKRILALAQGIVEMLRAEDDPTLRDVDENDVEVWDAYVGDHGYATSTPHSAFALEYFARKEGVLLDPVYTAKAAAALFDKRLEGKRVLFVHTGGAHALFHYRPRLLRSADGRDAVAVHLGGGSAGSVEDGAPPSAAAAVPPPAEEGGAGGTHSKHADGDGADPAPRKAPKCSLPPKNAAKDKRHGKGNKRKKKK